VEHRDHLTYCFNYLFHSFSLLARLCLTYATFVTLHLHCTYGWGGQEMKTTIGNRFLHHIAHLLFLLKCSINLKNRLHNIRVAPHTRRLLASYMAFTNLIPALKKIVRGNLNRIENFFQERHGRRSYDDIRKTIWLTRPDDDIRKTIWLTRPDLRDMYRDNLPLFEWWLIVVGVLEYRGLSEIIPEIPEALLTEPAPEAFIRDGPALTKFMKQVWLARTDLKNAFDLRTFRGQENFINWYFVNGARELNLARVFTKEQCGYLNEPEEKFSGNNFSPVSRLMAAIWKTRPDLQKQYDLNTLKGCDGFIRWYFTHGLVQYKLDEILNVEQIKALQAPSASFKGVTRILTLIWEMDEEVRGEFTDLGDGFKNWARDDGVESYPVLQKVFPPSAPKISKTASIHALSGSCPYGVNLIGHARGQFGIGEDVRMASLAMESAGIPFTIYNVDPGKNVCQKDESVASQISKNLPYATNIFCMTGMETARLAAVEGSGIFDGRHNIGFWPWELPEWPHEWRHAYNLVDEIWASSRYTYEAYARSSNKPVRHMPMVVTVDQTAGLTRRQFKLPEARFLFVFSFDFLSGTSRKNPEACIRAFQIAFENSNLSVGLVVKAMRAKDDNPQWKAILDLASADDRITIINRTLNRPEVLDLYRACDCFVSLHRSEGFGRGIVEAMMLDKPVIVTGYSGNMDFTTSRTAALVEYNLKKVGAGDYPFGVDQMWAEPNIDHAAQWMRIIAGDPGVRARLSSSGQQFTSTAYSPKAVGSRYAHGLKNNNEPDVLPKPGH
jgi:glycosyltransferase involved in cell wall biosynthesis